MAPPPPPPPSQPRDHILQDRQRTLLASIPSRARSGSPDDKGAGKGAGAQRSVNERLAESRRTARSSLPLEGTSTSQHAGTSTGTGTGSASARAGLNYLSSTAAAEQDLNEAHRVRALKRAVAGPAPPQSWRNEFLSGRTLPPHLAQGRSGLSSSHIKTGEKGKSIQQALQGPAQAPVFVPEETRRRTCAALRRFLKPAVSAISADTPLKPASLQELVLRCVISDVNLGARRSVLFDVVRYLPPHLKLRLMSLAGREARAEPLTDAAFRALWPELHRKRTGYAAQNQNGATASEEEFGASAESTASVGDNDGDGDGDGDWDWDSSDEPQKGHESSVDSTTGPPDLLDLSFSLLSAQTLRALLLPTGSFNLHLRSLSLSGFGVVPLSPGIGGTGVLPLLTSLPNLEVLSLAGTSLASRSRIGSGSGSGTGSGSGSGPDIRSVFDGRAVLRRIGRAVTRLRVLDLSRCEWVNGESLAAIEWARTWSENGGNPGGGGGQFMRLQHLVVEGCPSFIAPAQGGGPETEPRAQAAGRFVASWHADFHSPRLSASAFSNTHTPAHAHARQGVSAIRTSHGTSLQPRGGRPSVNVGGSASAGSANSEYPTRDSRTGRHIERWEWERARVLDSVRGRNVRGGAEGELELERGLDGGEEDGGEHRQVMVSDDQPRGGKEEERRPWIEVWF